MAAQNESGPLHRTSSNASQDNQLGEKQTQKPQGLRVFFSKLGDLPEWTIGGKHLEGAALNWSIGCIASCGFLMFG